MSETVEEDSAVMPGGVAGGGGGGGVIPKIFSWGCAAGTLKTLTYTRPILASFILQS